MVDTSKRGSYAAPATAGMIYGRGTIKNLDDVILNIGGSKAFILTGLSLNEKTPVISDIQKSLKSAHVGTFGKIRQHVPIADIRHALLLVKESGADVLVAVGGGSVIDAAKAVTYHLHGETKHWIPSVAVPTTLSVAETSSRAGFTSDEGHKVRVMNENIAPKIVIYDGDIALHTPLKLWLSTGIRALDHAVELLYHPYAPEVPRKRLALEAIRDLFTYLPMSHRDPENADIRQSLLLAGYMAGFPWLPKVNVGLSHSIGHAIGASYGIPHGMTSCMTLAPVVHLKAESSCEEAQQISRVIPYLGMKSSGSAVKDAHYFGDLVAELVDSLDLNTSLAEYGVRHNEEEVIAERALALHGGRANSDFRHVTNIVRQLY